MNRKTKLTKIPPGFVSRKDYPIGQFGSGNSNQHGGCPMGMYQSGPQLGGSAQSGGAILPAIAAVYAGLKAVQPFSKAKKALEDNVGDSGKKSTGYKIAHKIASVGSSLGFGQVGSNLGPITYQSGVYQPTTGKSSIKPRQKGTGRKRRKNKK